MNKTSILTAGLALMTVVALIGWTKIPSRADETTPPPPTIVPDRPTAIMDVGNYGRDNVVVAYPNGNLVLVSPDRARSFHQTEDGTLSQVSVLKY